MVDTNSSLLNKAGIKAKMSKIALFTVITLLAIAPTVAKATTGDAVGDGVTTDELEGVWNKVGSIVEGAGGKLAAAGIIITSVWNREKIGIPYMALGIASGILLPSLPSFVNSFTFTI